MVATQQHGSLTEKLIDYIQDAYALEQNVLRMLDSMISTTRDQETLGALRRHRAETEQHRQRVGQRLEQLGRSPSMAASVPAIMGAWLKGLGDQVRSDKPGKNARDAYVTEHVEIAAYSLLERLADRCGDSQTAHMAREIRADEEAMAQWLAERWDKWVDRTLEEANLRPRTGDMQSDLHSHWGSERATGWFGRSGDRSGHRSGGWTGSHSGGDVASMNGVRRLVGWSTGLGLGGYLIYLAARNRDRIASTLGSMTGSSSMTSRMSSASQHGGWGRHSGLTGHVKDVMTPNPAVCTKDTGLDDVARIMAKFDCGAVPVVVSNADQHMVGVITDRDIVLRTLANEKDPFEMAAGDCMTPDVITVTPETGVQDCADLMRRHQIRRIFVKDQSGRCCGVVAQADLVRHMPEHQAGEVVQEVSQPAGAAF